MQFMILAYDGKDADAINRRLAVRDQHIALSDKLIAEGRQLFGTALLDENDKMIGSMLIVDYPTRDELDAWLKIEPYVVGNVWDPNATQVIPVRVGPSFL